MKTVIWIGRFNFGEGGLARSARQNVRALQPFLKDLKVGPLSVLGKNHDFTSIVKEIDDDDNLEQFFRIVNHLPTTDPEADGYYSVIEYDRIMDSWADIFNRSETKVVMTESTFCKNIFSNQMNNPNKIKVIPYSLPDKFLNYSEGGAKYLPDYLISAKKQDKFVFGTIFEWVPRKAPENTINAFLNEFKENELVYLVIRTQNIDTIPEDYKNLFIGCLKDENNYEKFKRAIQQKRIIFVTDYIKDLIQFYRGINSYISVTTGEGFGQTLAEAMACNRPTIGANHSGNLEFMNESNSYLCEVENWTPIIPRSRDEIGKGYQWKLPLIPSIQQKMRQVYEEWKEPGNKISIKKEFASELRAYLHPQKNGKLLFNAIKIHLDN